MNIANAVEELKRKEVFSVLPEVSAFEAAKLMEDKNISALLVVKMSRRGKANLLGIITERDIVRRLMLKGLDAKKTPVKKLMTRKNKIVSIGQKPTFHECLDLMDTNKIRHLPILHYGNVVGMISIRDLLNAHIVGKEEVHITFQAYTLHRT